MASKADHWRDTLRGCPDRMRRGTSLYFIDASLNFAISFVASMIEPQQGRVPPGVPVPPRESGGGRATIGANPAPERQRRRPRAAGGAHLTGGPSPGRGVEGG